MGRFMGKSWTLINIPRLQKQDDSYAFTDYEKAEELDSYFASISTVDETDIEIPPFANHSDVEFTQIQTAESEVLDILKAVKLHKATDTDGISNRMLVDMQ